MKSKKGLISLFSIVLASLLSGCSTDLAVLDPKGPVARSQFELISFSFWMMLFVVIVVFVLFGYIVWKYREKPENADYEPKEVHGNTKLEIIWTVIPILIVVALSIPTVMTTYQLEEVPEGYEEVEPITIHATAADWKWIFSYPEQGIETVNYVNIPEDTPIKFKLTSASTMQSFWIPQLGGQEYAMTGHPTELILLADEQGSFLGRNSNFNGEGYNDMEFEVLSQSRSDFDEWVEEVQETAPTLKEEKYAELLKPTHLGRMTFSNTHLEWVDHSKPGAKLYLHPELYFKHGEGEH